jgi:RNA polymerase sigma factor (TIGR02999 family)
VLQRLQTVPGGIGLPMNDVTRILSAIEQGDPSAAEQLLPLLYQELRRLAAQKLAQEKPGQTLQATALVHEAYLRLVGGEDRHWNGRGHFFAAAAEAMRRILVERARRRKRLKRGGGLHRVDLDGPELSYQSSGEDVLAIDDALEKLAADNPDAANLVRLRYFAGLSVEEAARASGIPRSTAYAHWAYARACLRCLLGGDERPTGA